jgi:hypothetical protein
MSLLTCTNGLNQLTLDLTQQFAGNLFNSIKTFINLKIEVNYKITVEVGTNLSAN